MNNIYVSNNSLRTAYHISSTNQYYYFNLIQYTIYSKRKTNPPNVKCKMPCQRPFMTKLPSYHYHSPLLSEPQPSRPLDVYTHFRFTCKSNASHFSPTNILNSHTDTYTYTIYLIIHIHI